MAERVSDNLFRKVSIDRYPSARLFFTFPPLSPYIGCPVLTQVDIFDISKATNIINEKFDEPSTPVSPNDNLDSSITPAKYYPFLSFNDNTQLSKFGLINGGPLNGPGLLNEKWESIALLPTENKENEFFMLSV